MFDIFEICFQRIWAIYYDICDAALPFGFSGFWRTMSGAGRSCVVYQKYNTNIIYGIEMVYFYEWWSKQLIKPH